MKPVDIKINPIDRDEIEEKDDKWDDGFMHDTMIRCDELRRFNATLETSSDKDIMLDKDKLKKRYDRTGCKSNI